MITENSHWDRISFNFQKLEAVTALFFFFKLSYVIILCKERLYNLIFERAKITNQIYITYFICEGLDFIYYFGFILTNILGHNENKRAEVSEVWDKL